MTSSNRASMLTSNPSTAVVVDEPSVRREQTGTEENNTPRSAFNRRMQEARKSSHLQPYLDNNQFKYGFTAGVEMTLDVIHQHGYQLLDPEGRVVNYKDAPSLACGVWHTEDIVLDRETLEYQRRLQRGVSIKIDGHLAKIETVHELPNGNLEVHYTHGNAALRYFITGLGMNMEGSHSAYLRLSDIEIID